MAIWMLWLWACGASPEPEAVLQPVQVQAPVAVTQRSHLQAAADRAMTHEAVQAAKLGERKLELRAMLEDGTVDAWSAEQQWAYLRELKDVYVEQDRLDPNSVRRKASSTSLPPCDETELSCRDAKRVELLLSGAYAGDGNPHEALLRMRAAQEPDLPFHPEWADAWLELFGKTRADVTELEYHQWGTIDPVATFDPTGAED